ncbi:MAG: hypothetical protein QNK23_09720 [Crocinitomicaceae bacterium]|nr:hypothetical protein [Crocinitomicaceae bacterium]
MEKRSLLIICLLLGHLSFGQKRIGFDFNTRLSDIQLTAHYQEVIKNGFIYSVGIFGGVIGSKMEVYVYHDPDDVRNGLRVHSPFPFANQAIIDTSGAYNLYNYSFQSSGIGISGGLGYFIEFGESSQGLRINVNGRIGYAKSKFTGAYASQDNDRTLLQRNTFHHMFVGVGLEMYHTVRISGRWTFYYGFKAPYYFNIDKGRFNSRNWEDTFSGIEPDFSIGFTRVIGKCD